MGTINQTAIGAFVLWFVVFYVYNGLGITLGYHRLLTHKSLKVPQWLMYLIVSGGYFCLMGAPIVWVGVHRLHHQKSDQPGDPHSPRKGFRYALYEWMYDTRSVQSDEELQKQCPDLMNNRLFRWLGCTHDPGQAQLCLGLNIVLRILIWLVLGTPAVLANVAATFIVFWSTQFVNTFCHMKDYGYRNFETREDSRNVWWVGMLALGEGWHNNHHAIPKSARHGMNWFEVDITWYAVWILEKLGLATNVIRPPKRLADKKLAAAQEAASFIVPMGENLVVEPVLVEKS